MPGSRRGRSPAIATKSSAPWWRRFVFRKYLDYDAYDGLRDVHRQIREQGRRRDYASNIKLGPGGIREIEFIVQALQLVRGGREPALRVRGTLPALDVLCDRGLLPAAAVSELRDAYEFLRNVEHRLQYRDDAQTHELPEDEISRHALARAAGFADASPFESALGDRRAAVDRHFDALFGESRRKNAIMSSPSIWLDPAPDDTRLCIAARRRIRRSDGVDRPACARAARRPLSAAADRIAAALRRAGAAAPPRSRGRQVSRRRCLRACLRFLETVSGRSAYLALLVEHPPVLPRLAHLMAASAWAADYLTPPSHPAGRASRQRRAALRARWDEWRRELDEQIVAQSGDAERQIDALRHFQHAQTFRLLVQDLDGRLTCRAPRRSSIGARRHRARRYAQALLVADAGPDAVRRRNSQSSATASSAERSSVMRRTSISCFCTTNATKPHRQRYARLAQRLNTALTSMTGAGRLYDTDLRLRPDGASGLIGIEPGRVPEISARAGVDLGASGADARALRRRRRRASAPRSKPSAKRSCVFRAIRRSCATISWRCGSRMHAAHPNRSELFDLKHDPGGMVDIEFAVQYLVLAHSHSQRELTRNAGNIALLAVSAGLDARAGRHRGCRAQTRIANIVGCSTRSAFKAHARRESRPARNCRVAMPSRALWNHVFGGPWAESPAANRLK